MHMLWQVREEIHLFISRTDGHINFKFGCNYCHGATKIAAYICGRWLALCRYAEY